MNTSKRLRQSILINEKNFATSTSAFIETKSISQTTGNHKKSSQANQLVDLQQQTDGFYSESKLVEDHYEIISKLSTKNKHMNANITKTIADKTQSNSEDDWVCPVAVALRRAGYNVPLRPSKSWLERDRKKQALLREQQKLSKEILNNLTPTQ